MGDKTVRIDKFLWAVRLYKTRSQAAEACKKSHVFIDGNTVKASREVRADDVFVVKKNPINYKYRIKELLTNRVGAKLVENYIDDITPEEELFKLEVDKNAPHFKRNRGAGRPTKKERRDIEKLGF